MKVVEKQLKEQKNRKDSNKNTPLKKGVMWIENNRPQA